MRLDLQNYQLHAFTASQLIRLNALDNSGYEATSIWIRMWTSNKAGFLVESIEAAVDWLNTQPNDTQEEFSNRLQVLLEQRSVVDEKIPSAPESNVAQAETLAKCKIVMNGMVLNTAVVAYAVQEFTTGEARSFNGVVIYKPSEVLFYVTRGPQKIEYIAKEPYAKFEGYVASAREARKILSLLNTTNHNMDKYTVNRTMAAISALDSRTSSS